MNMPNQPKLLEEVLKKQFGFKKNGRPLNREQREWASKARAIYQKLKVEEDWPYVPGSPCELEMIDFFITGKNRPTLHILNHDWKAQIVVLRETYIDGEKRLAWQMDDNSEWLGDAKKDTCQLLDGSRFLIQFYMEEEEEEDYSRPRKKGGHWDYHILLRKENVRRIRPWLACHTWIMRGLNKPWLEVAKQKEMKRDDTAKYQEDQKEKAERTPELSPGEFVQRFFFAGMHCQFNPSITRFLDSEFREELLEGRGIEERRIVERNMEKALIVERLIEELKTEGLWDKKGLVEGGEIEERLIVEPLIENALTVQRLIEVLKTEGLWDKKGLINEVLIKKRWVEEGLVKNIYFNSDRGMIFFQLKSFQEMRAEERAAPRLTLPGTF